MKHEITLNRIYRFTSAHRLQSDRLSADENQKLYDKCNNPNGHGHDYTLEVAVKGIPDRESGMIIGLEKFDLAVQSVLDRLDYRHLNNEVEFFKHHISTGEVIIQYLWDNLYKNFPAGILYRLKLWETNNNYFELGAV